MASTVLLVDDDAPIRALLRLVLDNDLRFSVIGETDNGQGAIDAVKRVQPDLVVLDQEMPVMSGVEAIPHMRRHAPNAKVLMFSVHPEAGRKERAFAAGAHDYLDKMTPMADFLDHLAQLVDS